MNHNIYSFYRQQIIQCVSDLSDAKILPPDLNTNAVTVQAPKEISHGDLATNVAMVLAKESDIKPRALAELLIPRLENLNHVSSAIIAGPGFINLKLENSFWHQHLATILSAGSFYGDNSIGNNESINVEYVSTNPTGPLHIGHCRVAVVGDVLANLLEKSGFKVTREYYINDAGGQADELARSTYQRYLQALGHTPDELGAYAGDYLIPVGQKLAETAKDIYVNQKEQAWLAPVRAFAINEMMTLIRDDLRQLGITQDQFSSELALVKAGKVEEALAHLESKGLIYKGVLDKPKGKQLEDWESREQTLFRSTAFGDDSDRALMKSDGTWTYFASDIAYHFDKLQRGCKKLVNVWGADHAGYVQRLTSATKALSGGQAKVTCLLAQMVRFMVDGEPVKMSKRAGNFITVQQALDQVGLKAMRFMMMSRKCDQALDFDFKKVIENSKDNPVFYVQYAYARVHSVKRHIQQTFPDLNLNPTSLAALDFTSMVQDAQIDVIKKLSQWPQVVQSAAELYEPHRISYYMQEVAAEFHCLWNLGRHTNNLRFINTQDPQETQINFALIQAVAIILLSGFKILGIVPDKEM